MGRTHLVAVDGRSGTGKTTFAARLGAAWGAPVVSIDDFTAPDIATWDQPRFLAEVVAPLRAGRPARHTVRRWTSTAPLGVRTTPPAPVVVCEGVSVTDRWLDLHVPDLWTLRIWVEAPLAVRRARVLARDGEAGLRGWATDWAPSEERWIRAQWPQVRADVAIDGTLAASVTVPPCRLT